MRDLHHADCRVAVDCYTIICDGPLMSIDGPTGPDSPDPPRPGQRVGALAEPRGKPRRSHEDVGHDGLGKGAVLNESNIYREPPPGWRHAIPASENSEQARLWVARRLLS